MAYEQRNFRIENRRYCIRLEPEFWGMLEQMAVEQDIDFRDLIHEVDRTRTGGERLGSALRCRAIGFYVRRALELN